MIFAFRAYVEIAFDLLFVDRVPTTRALDPKPFRHSPLGAGR